MKKTCNSINSCIEEKMLYLELDGYSILNCRKCSHRFCKIKDIENHIKETYSDDYFFEGKKGYPNYIEEGDVLIKSGVNYSKIISKFTPVGKLLDVGCAAGFILKGFEKCGWNCQGLEPNSSMASYGINKLNLDIKTGNLESFQTDQKFDLISLIQVIGHFADLDKAIENVSRLLTSNGMVLIESWDMNSIVAKTMGKHWHEYSPPSVINWFSDETLTQLFEYYGFSLIAKGRPAKKIGIKHGLSLLGESTPRFPFKKGIINFLTGNIGKFSIPYPPMDLKWYLFKKL